MNRVASLIDKNRMCRHSFILAIGGGAVLDATGFAAGIAHRGIRLIRMPTTTLAQNDAGVGVKNGINAFGRKNFLGSFTPPFAVINDFEFLKTLPRRYLRAGLVEAVKVALIKDRSFFDFLFRNRARLALFEPRVIEKAITRCAGLHLDHIATSGDPFEFGSSRPLDFGHWSAHKLEEMTNGRLNHGEAVAIGIALDSIYSHAVGYLSKDELGKILTILKDIGFVLYHPALSRMRIESALREFQEHLGGELTIPLLKGIGEKIEVHEIQTSMIGQGVRSLAEKEGGGER
jgi:3-dehydroquinate synthase